MYNTFLKYINNYRSALILKQIEKVHFDNQFLIVYFFIISFDHNSIDFLFIIGNDFDFSDSFNIEEDRRYIF